MDVAFVTIDGIVWHPPIDAIVASITVQRLLPLAQRFVPPGPRRDSAVADIPVAEGRTAAEMMRLGSKAFPPLSHVSSELAALQRLYESAVLVNQDFRIPNEETVTIYRVVGWQDSQIRSGREGESVCAPS